MIIGEIRSLASRDKFHVGFYGLRLFCQMNWLMKEKIFIVISVIFYNLNLAALVQNEVNRNTSFSFSCLLGKENHLASTIVLSIR